MPASRAPGSALSSTSLSLANPRAQRATVPFGTDLSRQRLRLSLGAGPPTIGGRRASRTSGAATGAGAGTGRHEVRQHPIPTGPVSVAPARTAASETLPAPVLDVHAGGRIAVVGERDLDFGGVGAVSPDMPQISEPPRRLPDRDLAPVDLQAGRGALDDAASGAGLEYHLKAGLGRDGMGNRPPARGLGGPDVERVTHGTVDKERHAQRLDHRCSGGLVFSASSRKRASASPQTSAR